MPDPLDKIQPVEEVTEPVITEKGERKWLKITEKKYYPAEPRPVKEMIEEPREPETKTEFELKEPCLWQCARCGCVIKSNPEPPIECFKEQGGCGRTTKFRMITKPINEIWKLPIWKDEEVDGFGLYQDIYELIKQLVIFPREMHYKVITLWIISTWKRECFDSVGFPVFRGIIGSGKTRALNIIAELGYRVVSASSATFPAIATLSHYHNVTLTIDEADNRLQPKYEKGSELLDFVKQSYKRGSKYVISDVDHVGEVIARNNFGFKAFAGEKSFNPALVSRGIDIFMEKGDPPVPKMKYMEIDFEKIRTQLLNYKYKTDDPPDLGEGFILKGRLREVYESIIRTAMHIGQTTDDIIEFALEVEKEEQEEMRASIQHDILLVIKGHSENQTLDDAPEQIFVKDIVDGIGWSGENRATQKLGYILKNMGLKKVRRMNGTVILLTGSNSKRLGYLYRRYGV